MEWGGQFQNLRAATRRLAIIVPVCLVLISAALYMAIGNALLTATVLTAGPLALANRMQPVVNIALGTSLSTVILTVPIMEALALYSGQAMQVSLLSVQTVMALLTLAGRECRPHGDVSHAQYVARVNRLWRGTVDKENMNEPSPPSTGLHTGVLYALLAAALFGASTPFAKILVGQVAPVTLAGMLYFGSGVGLLLCFIVRALFERDENDKPVALTGPDIPWLLGAIASGGIAGPVLLMVGLTMTPASSASLLLNMEGVLTALLAWFVFKENFDRRIFLGMVLIVLAGGLLSWEQVPALGVPWGALAIVAACLCWAIDNNLTRNVSASDPLQIAGIKGFVAGAVNLGIAFALGFKLPAATTMLTAGVVGFCGYGLSLVMFVLALRHLGTARTGAYFSAAPFVGAVISLLMLGDVPGPMFWIAAVLMGGGIWLHLSETHEHDHEHMPMEHAHEHSHDAHHQHQHDFEWDGKEPHAHAHRHAPLKHAHPHYPDIHHRHDH